MPQERWHSKTSFFNLKVLPACIVSSIMDKMSSFLLVFLMVVLLTVDCERRCDIKLFYGCIEHKNTNEENKGTYVN